MRNSSESLDKMANGMLPVIDAVLKRMEDREVSRKTVVGF